MSTGRADRKKAQRKLFCALLAASLLICAGAGAETAEGPDMNLVNPDMILAQDTVDYLHLTTPEGDRIVVRTDPSVPGRGEADQQGNEPDYSGLLGFAALPEDPEIGNSPAFCTPSWEIPVYRRSGNRNTMVKSGTLSHKTPVLVIRQKLREAGNGGYSGWLQVVRLDTRQVAWIDVAHFVTVPYWTLELKDAARYGFSIAVYRSRSRYEPMDRKKHHGPLPDGTWVLMCDKAVFPRHNSPDKENRPLLGIIFRNPKSEKESYLRFFLFFNTDDLTLVY